MLRLVAYAQPPATGIAGSYRYTNKTPGPYQWPYASATTFPFAVRGTQVRIYSDTIATGNELADALVYRLPAGQTTDAKAIASRGNEPFVSDQNGYLRGRGELALGDQLMALLPITSTETHTLYHTSARPNETGLEMFEVMAPGIQELAISSENALMVFDLDVSLEWDARKDDIFLNQLESDLQRTSQILYDLTNGQVALGKIRVYHNKQNWLDSHILIYATNNLRPSADLGGIVKNSVHDVLSNGQMIPDAYLRGQVRMSAMWNRFGVPEGEVGEDWPRTLAHELGHYLLFLPDNYLGLSEDGLLTLVDCHGSAMSDPYGEDYSEFLTRQEWTGDCLNTLAQHTTGRTDWETIKKFYTMFDASGGNMGPSNLPLAITEVTFIDPETPIQTLDDPFFNVTDENNNQLRLPFGQAQGYLFKNQGTTDPTDDRVMPVGSPIENQLRVRGVESGDRLCLFDYSQSPRRLGCIEQVNQSSRNLSLHQVPSWEPQIKVTSITSVTLAVTVTQAIASDIALHMQVLPAARPNGMEFYTSPIATLNRVPNTDIFTQTITLSYPIANGFIRVWVEGAPLQEDITEFFFSGNWGFGTYKHAWGPSSHRYGWGASRKNSWQAPISTRDGQVTVFDLDNILGGSSNYALQLLSTPPNLPSWLTQVGQAYHFSAAQALPESLNIKFEYLERELPLSREDRLRIYYSPDEGQSWQPLDTSLDTHHNHASAYMPGEGIYTVISTVEIEPFDVGWNPFTYPVADSRAIATALASIEDKYTSVYYDQPNSSEWLLHDQTVVDEHPEFSTLVNDLIDFEDGKSYWIHTTEPVNLYMAPGSGTRRRMHIRGIEFPPATYYGWIMPNESFQPVVGMSVKARIGDIVCGEGTIEERNGQLAYKLQVKAENILGQANGCGTSQRQITFEVGDWVMQAQPNWDNSQAWFHSLPKSTPDPSERLYLPLLLTR